MIMLLKSVIGKPNCVLYKKQNVVKISSGHLNYEQFHVKSCEEFKLLLVILMKIVVFVL